MGSLLFSMLVFGMISICQAQSRQATGGGNNSELVTIKDEISPK